LAARLLAPLNPEQQRLVDLAASRLAGGGWPIFDFIDGEFERDGIDAWAVLESLPIVRGNGEYPIAWCPRPPGGRAVPTEHIGLTILGMHHAAQSSPAAKAIVFSFLALLPKLAMVRRSQSGHPEQPRQLKLSAGSSLLTDFGDGVPGFPVLPTEFLYYLLGREPATWLGAAQLSGPSWEREIPREIGRFAKVDSIDAYIAATVERVYQEPASVPMAAPSPLGLVAALDYLDTVWRVATPGGKHLFELHSAQRAAQLAFPAQTENEFESRLTGLGEILRSVNVPSSGGKPKGRDKPLDALSDYLVALLPASGQRIRASISTLGSVIDVRDGSQHSAARSKTATALIQLGVGYPPAAGWPAAWSVVSARTIEALDAIREELASST
jgi:hypothetical protein